MPQEYQNKKSPILKGKKAQNTRESKKNAWEIYKMFAKTLYSSTGFLPHEVYGNIERRLI